jgi:hypothetical protein
MTDPPSSPPREGPEALPASPGALQLGPRASLAASTIQALVRTARALTLYAPTNDLVRQFLAEFRTRAEAATRDAAVAIDVGPHELRCEGEVVYKEEDREKSLAFRLYRDGIRRLVLKQGAPFGELMRLLEVLTVRFTGIRDAEDDVVTALRRAELHAIEIVAVEGFTDQDDDPDAELGRATPLARTLAPTFDLPLPRLAAPGPVAHRVLPDEELAPLWAATEPEAVEAGALLLAAELVARHAQGAVTADEVTQYCAELRDVLVADRHLGALASLADLVLRQPDPTLRDRVLQAFADARMLEALLASVPSGRGALPPDAVRLLPFVSAAMLLDHLATEAGDREAILGLVEARLPGDADLVIERLAAAPAPVARALARSIGARAPEKMPAAAAALLANVDEGIRLDALRALAALPVGAEVARVVPLLDAPAPQVRIAAARALERHGSAGHARAVAAGLLSGRVASREEAAAFGRAMAILNPGAALREFDAWLKEPRRGLLGRLRGNERDELLCWAAVAGLGATMEPEGERRLVAFAAEVRDDALREHCRATLAQRHAGGRHGRDR